MADNDCLSAEKDGLGVVIENYRLGGRWKGSEIDEIIETNERLRAALERITAMSTGDDASSFMRKIAREALAAVEEASDE